jgi:hypothetical protein
MLNFFKKNKPLTSSQVAVHGETDKNKDMEKLICTFLQIFNIRMEDKNWLLHSSKKVWNLVYLKGSVDKIDGIYKSQ